MIARFAVIVLLLALVSAGTAPVPAVAQGGPIKIGLLVPLTGDMMTISPLTSSAFSSTRYKSAIVAARFAWIIGLPPSFNRTAA